VTYLVDANVLSEATRPKSSAGVVDWLRTHEPEIVVDPIILGEIRFGIATCNERDFAKAGVTIVNPLS